MTSKVDFAALENKLDANLHPKLFDQTFEICDGPPFPNGKTLHLGHVHIACIKDTIIRYKQLTGKNIKHALGYDCHGLPVETEVSKMLGLKSLQDIHNFGLDRYIQECRRFVTENIKMWQPLYQRLGRQTHFQPPYQTMDLDYMAREWQIWAKLVEQGFVYSGCKVMPYCPECETVLSISEATSEDVYKLITTTAVHVRFRLSPRSEAELIAKFPKLKAPIYLVAFTTTPWTLPGNAALAIGKFDYLAKYDNEYQATHIYLDQDGQRGTSVGINYTDLLYKTYLPINNSANQEQKILLGPFVKEEGTGIVHIAPMFGQDDYNLCMDEKISMPPNYLDSKAKYKSSQEQKEMDLAAFNKFLIKDLTAKKIIIKEFPFKHSYPHCWRTDTPLIYRAVPSWFIATSKMTDKLVEKNNSIDWIGYIGPKRFKNWLQQSHDWCVSRNRVWGTPMPIWIADDGTILHISSVVHLKELAKIDTLTDLHLDTVAKIIIQTDKTYKHCGLIFDCWFDSGCATQESHNALICEGLDQTRGWFYTTHVLNSTLNHRAVHHIICSGLILDSEGKKFSKKLKNFVDPMELCNKYGADALRLSLIDSPAALGDTFRFDERALHEINRKFVALLSALGFLQENLQIQPNQDLLKKELSQILDESGLDRNQINEHSLKYGILDGWILDEVKITYNRLRDRVGDYKLSGCKDVILEFIDNLTNWYIRLNRKSLKVVSQVGNEMTSSRIHPDHANYSLIVLFNVIREFSVALHPFMPFMSMHLWTKLNELIGTNFSMAEQKYKRFYNINENMYKLRLMRKIKQIIEMARYLRQQSKLTTAKMPISELKVIFDRDMYDSEVYDILESNGDVQNIILEEVNCISLCFGDKVDKKYELELNKPLISKRFKHDAKYVFQAAENLDQDDIREIFHRKQWQTSGDFLIEPEYKINIIPEFKLSPMQTLSTVGELTIIIDCSWSEALANKYFVRLLTHEIQNMRKEAGLKPWNKIEFYCDVQPVMQDEKTYELLSNNLGYQVKAQSLELAQKESANPLKLITRKKIDVLNYSVDVSISVCAPLDS